MLGFIRRNIRCILTTIFSILLGIMFILFDHDTEQKVIFNLVIGIILYFCFYSIHKVKKAESKTNKILYMINILLNIVLVIVYLFWLKENTSRFLGLLLMLFPVIRAILAKNWAMQMYYDRYFYLFSMFVLVFSPYETNETGFIFLTVLTFTLPIILIYYLIMYGRIVIKKD